MQKSTQTQPFATNAATAIDNKATTLYCLVAISIFSLLFILFLSSTSRPPPSPSPDPFLFPNGETPDHQRQHRLVNHQNPSDSSPPTPPSVAYLISGSAKDSRRLLRLLFSVYHPRNQYLLHLDLLAPQAERDFLALTVQSIPIFKAAQNVNVIGKADFSYPKGSSSISSTLHGASILLRISAKWDWFINLSAADYPLITQDDLLHILSYLPKDLNFMNHTSYIGWKESRKLKPIIVDPGLYLLEKSEMFYATQKRELPDAYQLFTGPFVCRTTVNYNLQYASFDAKQERRPLNSSDFDDLIKSGAAFASPFLPDDPVLKRIDEEVLGCGPGKPVPGGWCLGEPGNDTCSIWGDADILRPGSGANRLEKRVTELLSNGTFLSTQCATK